MCSEIAKQYKEYDTITLLTLGSKKYLTQLQEKKGLLDILANTVFA